MEDDNIEDLQQMQQKQTASFKKKPTIVLSEDARDLETLMEHEELVNKTIQEIGLDTLP